MPILASFVRFDPKVFSWVSRLVKPLMIPCVLNELPPFGREDSDR